MKLLNGIATEPMDTTTKTDPNAVPDGSCPTPTPPPPAEVANNLDTPLDFSLAIKPKGTPLFRLSALYKGRLRFCIYLHMLLFLVMCAKLSEDVLDRMDIFILELEELYIPKPSLWEWYWAAGIIFDFFGFRAIANNNLHHLYKFQAGNVVFGLCPLLYVFVYYFNDVWEYAEKKNEAEVEKWQGFPVGLWWYGFIMVASQVHIFSLFFTAKLLKIWKAKAKKKMT